MYAKIPRYLLVYNALKTRIENLEYPPGALLPPEPELEKFYKVSRTTIRKSVEMLQDQGFVLIRQGIGTRILDFKATQKLQYVTSFSETLIEQGFQVDHKLLSLEFETASGRIAEELKTPDGTGLVRIERLAYANGSPIALMTNILTAEMLPGIRERSDKIRSLYSFLEREYHIFIDAATDFLSARIAEPEESRQLGIRDGDPLLIVKRISYVGGHPMEVAQLRIVADKYEYSVHTKDRPPQGL